MGFLKIKMLSYITILFALIACALSASLHSEVLSVHNVTDTCDKPCPCCTPSIDAKASVIESYKKHRAHAALIGDYGDCSVNNAGYTWEVDWGDGDAYKKHQEPMGPYQTTHTYAKKGKYTVDVKFCSHKHGPKYEGCEDQCDTFSETINVKP